jgi:hypothetical protein
VRALAGPLSSSSLASPRLPCPAPAPAPRLACSPWLRRWSLDGILRVGSYSCLLGATYLTEFNSGKPTPLAEFLSGVFGKVTDARFINRVMAWPATLESVFHYANNPDNSALGVLGQVMTCSMVAYYPLEHGWLLSTFKPQMVNIDGNKWSLWSCRFW